VNTPITLSVQATDPYTGAGIAGVAVTFGSGNKGTFSTNPLLPILPAQPTTTYTLPQTAERTRSRLPVQVIALLPSVKTAVPGAAAARFSRLRLFAGRTVATTLPLPLVVMAKTVWE